MSARIHFRPTRRLFLMGAAFSAGAVISGCATWNRLSWWTDPFKLGVAAGSPTAEGFVIWTRLAPDPLASPDGLGGMTGPATAVGYEVASDPAMKTIVQSGSAIADPAYGYSVHVELAGLQPGRPYYYRFHHGTATSRIGRGQTLAAEGSGLDKLRLGFVSCSNLEHGYFSAYRHLAAENPDAVLFLGDYIYEYVDGREGKVRQHSDNAEATTLPLYRNRHAQYKLDPDLQNLHAATTALLTWDDHEVMNDYADKWAMGLEPPEAFLRRRAAAFQAYYENMPVKPSLSRPEGPSMRIYDRFSFGELAQVSMIDGRQYAAREACYTEANNGRSHLESFKSCPELADRTRSITGAAQEEWLFEGLANSTKRWNVIGNDVLLAPFRQTVPEQPGETMYWTGDWNGYPGSRERLFKHIAASKVSNPVVVTGDLHAYWANDLRRDPASDKSPVIAAEFVGTSITSYGPPHDVFMGHMKNNPHVKFFDARTHGYAVLDITPDLITTRFEAVSDAKDPNATLSTLKTFVVENGVPGTKEA